MKRSFKNLKSNAVIFLFAIMLATSQLVACNSTQNLVKDETINTSNELTDEPKMPTNMDGESPTPPDMDGERPTPPNGFGGGPNGGPSDGPGGMPGGGNSKPDSYEAINVYNENQSVSGLNIESTKSDESAILVENSANVNIDNFTINRKSSDSTGGDSASFYWVGASALVTDGTLTLSNGTITTDSKGGAGVFAYDKGIAYVNDVTINTEQDTSGGIHVAGGGTLYATNVTATTSGGSSAAIRSDRGGGTLTSKNGGLFYTTNTESEFNLTNVDLKPSDDFEFLLQSTGNNNKRGWGSTGKNGANCTFNANNQEMNGNIIYDSISTLNLNLLNNTTFTGAILDDESFTGGIVGSGTSNVTIDDNSKWIVTDNSKITSLSLKGSLVDKNNNDVKVINTNGTILRDGNSEFTVTVNNLS